MMTQVLIAFAVIGLGLFFIYVITFFIESRHISVLKKRFYRDRARLGESEFLASIHPCKTPAFHVGARADS